MARASTAGIGTFGMTTNVATQAFFTNNFDLAPVGLYATGAVFQGWSVVSNTVDVLDDFTCLCQSNHIVGLLDGAISNSLPTTNALPLTNSYTYSLSYKVNHLPWLEGMVTWWPLDVDGSDIFGGLDGLLLGDVTFSHGPDRAVLRRLQRATEPELAGLPAARRCRRQPARDRKLCRGAGLLLHDDRHEQRH